VPVVGTNLGGTAELVRHERNGLLFEVDDADDLARQLQRLLDEPELLPRLRLAENPFRTAENDYERAVELYGSLVAVGRDPAAPIDIDDAVAATVGAGVGFLT
jgi:glycosyltransferase involved in cell wall biosynthesis